MGIFYLLWFIITLLLVAVYRNINGDKTVDLQYFLNESFPDELPTT